MRIFRMIGMLLFVVITFLTSCSKEYDDSLLTNRVDNLENRVYKLEELCSQMNTNISSLQTIVNVLQDKDYITHVSPINKEGQIIGYTIAFAKNKSITIYHGKDGYNGSDGEDGKTPVIGVKNDIDGIFYWTVNGEWLFDGNGDKIKAQGIDGGDGQNGQDGKDGIDGTDGINGLDGKDGITPKLKIENDYWYVSYDNSVTWMKLGKAIGEDGEDGEDGSNGKDGDSMFKDIAIEDGAVSFTLNDGSNTILSIPLCKPTTLSVHIEEAGTLKKLLTDEEKRTTLSLKVIGVINEDDMKTINSQMLVLEYLDLEKASFEDSSNYFSINPYGTSLVNRTLRTVILPSNGLVNLQKINCLNLEKLVVTSNAFIGGASYGLCDNLVSLVFAEGVEHIQQYNCGFFPIVEFPATTVKVDFRAFSKSRAEIPVTEEIFCRAATPPVVGEVDPLNGNFVEYAFYDYYKPLSEYVLYVPAESVELYKSANAWKEFGKILPITE